MSHTSLATLSVGHDLAYWYINAGTFPCSIVLCSLSLHFWVHKKLHTNLTDIKIILLNTFLLQTYIARQGFLWGGGSKVHLALYHSRWLLGPWPVRLAQLVVHQPARRRDHQFSSRKGHMPGLQVRSLVGACAGGNWSNCLYHINVSLPLFLLPFPSLEK